MSRLNEFFGVVIEVVESHGGSINKFEGDAALAVFGAPVPARRRRGLRAGRRARAGEALPEEIDVLEAGIGVSAGPTVAGNVGSESRYEYTVIGDPVNEAARLCELAKETTRRVLASAAAVERASDEEARALGARRRGGVARPQQAHADCHLRRLKGR